MCVRVCMCTFDVCVREVLKFICVYFREYMHVDQCVCMFVCRGSEVRAFVPDSPV